MKNAKLTPNPYDDEFCKAVEAAERRYAEAVKAAARRCDVEFREALDAAERRLKERKE